MGKVDTWKERERERERERESERERVRGIETYTQYGQASRWLCSISHKLSTGTILIGD